MIFHTMKVAARGIAIAGSITAVVLISGCGQAKRDSDIKENITIVAKENLNFAGVSYTVQNSVVTLMGRCPSDKARKQVIQTVENIGVVKDVDDQLEIGPVTIDQSLPLKQAVDSVLAKYPSVVAEVSSSQVLLKGEVPQAEAQRMLTAVRGLQPPLIINNVALE